MSANVASVPPLLAVRDLAVGFRVQRGIGARAAHVVKAVDGVSFDVGREETLALVGESGSGKTTLGRAILRLVEPDSGRALYRPDPAAAARDLFELSPRALRDVRRDLQIVFQDPLASLNPRLSIGAALEEPLRVHRAASSDEIDERVVTLLGQVGLSSEVRARHPHELSGGQRQRVAIARALALGPRFIVCDEAVSALDASLQAEILNLLEDLQAARGLSYLFIAHDLSIVRHFADRVAVMYFGRIVESGTVEEIFETPAHPYTQVLLRSIPRLELGGGQLELGGRQREKIAPSTPPGSPQPADHESPAGDPRSAIDPPSGCPFHPRCPLAEVQCRATQPITAALSKTHSVSCHLLDPA